MEVIEMIRDKTELLLLAKSNFKIIYLLPCVQIWCGK